jgi:hypothetical protein
MNRARPPTPRLTPIARRELSWQAPHRVFRQIPSLLELIEDWPSSSSRGNRPGVLPHIIGKVYLRTLNLNTVLDFSSTDGSTDGVTNRDDCRLCMLKPTTIQISPAVCLRLQPISHPLPARRLVAEPEKIVPAQALLYACPTSAGAPSPVKQNSANGIQINQND